MDYSAFNLISSNDYLVNALFIPDARRENVTWIGSIGVVMNKAVYHRGSKVTYFKFDANSRTVHIGSKTTLNARAIQGLVSENGTISVVEATSSSQRPVVDFDLKEIGLHFNLKFIDTHLDMMWHSPIKGSDAHGLIGEHISYIYTHTMSYIVWVWH